MKARRSHRAVQLVCAFAFVAWGCGARTPLRAPDANSSVDVPTPRDVTPRDGPIDTPRADAIVPDVQDPCVIDPGPLRGALCQRAIVAEPATLSCPGGFVDVVAQGPGTLVWECDGDRAEARFGDRTYRGSRVGTFMTLCISTEFDYVDGCRWQSSQRLEGDTARGTLDLTYREVAIRGNTCFPPCSADARVRVP